MALRLALNLFKFSTYFQAIVVLSAYRMRNQRRPTNHWNQDYRFNRPRALYQSLAKRSAMKRERILDSLGGDYLIRKRDF